jgi:hypothetical protein
MARHAVLNSQILNMISHSGNVSFNEDHAPMAYMLDSVHFCYKTQNILNRVKLKESVM